MANKNLEKDTEVSSDEIITWGQVVTQTQKNKLISSVIAEIKRLRSLEELRGILGNSITIKTRHFADGYMMDYSIVIHRDGKLVQKDVSDTMYPQTSRYIDNSRLPEIIERYKLVPEDVRRVTESLHK